MSSPETTPIERDWIECWACGGEGVLEGTCTCGEDCCCCAEPEPQTCDICHGDGGWKRQHRPEEAALAMNTDPGM